jgi:PAS domain S-box-containing protein
MRARAKNFLVLGLGLLLASLGIYNIVLKATWTLMDDGVFWKDGPEGVMAGRLAVGGPADRAGLRVGDVLLALDGREVLTAEQVEGVLAERPSGAMVTYAVLREHERRALEVTVKPLSKGNVSLFYYLSLVGFFSLVVGTIVMLRRPPDRAALHFYAICLLFFLMYSTSYTGRLDFADWTLLWTDHLAILFLPVVFLHFCLSFPERRLRTSRGWLIPVAYLPALALAGAAVTSQVLFFTNARSEALWKITSAIDRYKPLYFALLFALSFAILLDSYRKTRRITARKQMKWLVMGTGAGVLPFFLFYALPFAAGREPRLAMELAGYIPLALIPLSLAYAVVKHRLMDVELIFRRTLVYTLATATIIGIALLAVNLFAVAFSGHDEPHETLIAILCTLVVVLLFTPLKSRLQDGIDRLFLRERYTSRRALLRLSQELNDDLDLSRLAERLLDGVRTALGAEPLAVFLADDAGDFRVFRATGRGPQGGSLPGRGPLVQRLRDGEHVNAEAAPETVPEADELSLSHYFPCRAKGELIAVLGVGRKEGLDPLNSEETDLLQALAGQAATAFMNGRLLLSLREQAHELTELKEYNEYILESMDSGILVLDLEGRVVRWNRAMESLYGRRRDEVFRRPLAEVFPEPFADAVRSILGGGRPGDDVAHIYKLHLPTPDGRPLMVNVSAAPFHVGSGEREGTVLILDDVTSRVRLEEQLQHSEKMASIGLLAAGVAHEVNTPLAGISSYTQMARAQVDGEHPAASLLEKIEKQTFRAAKIINNLLNFSRFHGPEFESLDVNKVLADVLSLVEHQLEAAHIKVRKELASALPAVRGNENRLQQVFFNLILNARDAMPRGGWLTLVTGADDDVVLVEIKDTGDGIRHEDIKRIYDPFFTTKGMGRGTGLGLSVSYGIVQEHGGAIFVSSAPGQGTAFQVTLPPLRVAEAARG